MMPKPAHTIGLAQDAQAYDNPSVGLSPLIYPSHLPMTETVWLLMQRAEI